MYKQEYTDNFGRHERMRTKDQLAKIKNLGGLISVMTKDDVQDTENGYCLPNAVCFFGGGGEGGKYTTTYNGPSNNYGLNNNCRYSTTEWAQLYMYGADTMAGPVSLGSDFNGVAGHVGPRYGSGACGGDPIERSAQEKGGRRLAYPFTIDGFGSFDKQTTGQRTFDFNTDGLAHVGLLPDMVADLKNVGITDTQLVPLFTSAQAYINMWAAATPVTASKLVVSTPAAVIDGTSFSFTITAEDSAGNTVTNYSGTVHFTSSDSAAILPANQTLSGGTGTFTATLNTVSGQTITATDTANSLITGMSGTITVNQPTAITSVNTATFTVGSAGSFQVNGTGYPAPTFSETGALPSGVTFSPSGLLSGTPTAGTGGSYRVAIKATNALAPDATQAFTLNVDQPPAITSANTTTFKLGVAGSFTVMATGYPAPTLSESGALPNGVTFISQTGTLSGTPAAGTGGTYTLTFTASNGVTPNAVGTFMLQVQDFSATVFPGSETIPSGHQGLFTIQTASLGGLTGNINFSCSGGPPHSTCAVSKPVTLGAKTLRIAVVTLYPSKTGDHGTWTLTFTGTIGAITHTYTATLTVK